MQTLYIVPTPIGNLEDMTLRALRILKEVSLIAAEDTRTSRVLLDHYDIKTPMTSYHEHNKLKKLDMIFNALAQGDVALISDAGTPGVSDPGYELVLEAIQRGITIVPLPGATAVTTALVASGLPSDSFIYLGFFPKRTKSLRDLLKSLENERRTLIGYENPYRVVETLSLVLDVLGDRQVCVAREITKMFEEFYRGTASEAIAYYRENNPRGEVTLLIGGTVDDGIWDEERVRAALEEEIASGESRSKAAKNIARLSGWKKSDVYALDIDTDL